MHELILNFLHHQPGLALARFPLDGGGLICSFAGRAGPLWVAKTAVDEAAITRLNAEASALRQMEPWADILGVPRRLGWDDGTIAPDGVACLIQSGVPGVRAAGVCDLHRPWAELPRDLHHSAAWLQQFQATVPPPRPLTLADLEHEIRNRAESACASHPEHVPLLLPVLAAIPPLPEPQRTAAAIHGDFWAGNVLLESTRGGSLERRAERGNERQCRSSAVNRSRPSGGRRERPGKKWRDTATAPHVIDWSGFGAGTSLDDLLTWMSQMSARKSSESRLHCWQANFFFPGTTRDFLRDWRLRCGYGESLARWAFYVFLLRRMSWELGFGLQSRDAIECAGAQRDWTEITAWLAQHRYPDPFTPLPV